MTSTTTMAYKRTLISILLSLIPTGLSAEEVLQSSPPVDQALQNPINITITLKLDPSLDWHHSKIVIDGNDLSKPLRPLLEGAVAVVLSDGQSVLAERDLSPEQMVLHLYGFEAAPGPHQVFLEIPRNGGTPLRYQTQYAVAR
jgi:hypothetical protein